MQILVVYDDQHRLVDNTSRTLGEILRRAGEEVDIIDLTDFTPHILQKYNVVVGLGAMLKSRLDKHFAQFLEENQQELLIKPFYLILHADSSGEHFLHQAGLNVPNPVLNHAQTFNIGFDYSTMKLPWWKQVLPIAKPQNNNYDWDQLGKIAQLIIEKRVGKLF